MTSRRMVRDEQGATLVLALVFMIIIALVLVPLVTLSGNGLQNTSNLLQEQSLEYRSNGAVEVAIQTVRYTDTSYSGGSCFASGSPTVQIGLAGPGNPPVYVNCRQSQTSEQYRRCRVRSMCTPVGRRVVRRPTTPWRRRSISTTGRPVHLFRSGHCGAVESIKSWLVHNANT